MQEFGSTAADDVRTTPSVHRHPLCLSVFFLFSSPNVRQALDKLWGASPATTLELRYVQPGWFARMTARARPCRRVPSLARLGVPLAQQDPEACVLFVTRLGGGKLQSETGLSRLPQTPTSLKRGEVEPAGNPSTRRGRRPPQAWAQVGPFIAGGGVLFTDIVHTFFCSNVHTTCIFVQ